MAKPNYYQAKKQKELARKARQQVKQQRKAERVTVPGEGTETSPAQDPSSAQDTNSGS